VPWRVRLSGPALRDFDGIIEWTARQFGAAQAERYEALIAAAFDRLREGPFQPLVQASTAGEDIRCLAVMDGRRRARHVVFFTWTAGPDHGRVVILRILHAAMDPTRHLGAGDSA
jgi:plasmid stabilization system protein ParE